MRRSYPLYMMVMAISIQAMIALAKSPNNESNQTRENCLKQWPSLSLDAQEVIKLTRAGTKAIKEAHEHPSSRTIDIIMDLLGKASAANSTDAQGSLGFYVIGYWMTDFMFWPSRKEEATHALAMLRIYALKQLKVGPPFGPFVQALALTPPRFTDDTYELPKEWLSLSLTAASEWQKCFKMVKGISAFK